MCQATNFWNVEQPSQLQYGRQRGEAVFSWRSYWSNLYRSRWWQWQFLLWIRCEYCPDNEDDSENKENDMEDDSFVLSPSNLGRMLKVCQMTKKVTVLPLELCRKFCVPNLASQNIYLTCIECIAGTHVTDSDLQLAASSSFPGQQSAALSNPL